MISSVTKVRRLEQHKNNSYQQLRAATALCATTTQGTDLSCYISGHTYREDRKKTIILVLQDSPKFWGFI